MNIINQAEILLSRGLHATRVAEGFDAACEAAVAHLAEIADKIEFSKDNIEPLMRTASTTLSSKILYSNSTTSKRKRYDQII